MSDAILSERGKMILYDITIYWHFQSKGIKISMSELNSPVSLSVATVNS